MHFGKALHYTMNKYISVFCLSLLVNFSLSSQGNSNVDAIFRSVVQVRNESYSAENKIEPWKVQNVQTGLGSGLVLGNGLILTNAHVVMDSRRILVRTGFSKKDYLATPKFLGFDCDLAILSIDDPDFNEETSTVPFATDLPTPGSDIIILGFPNGSDNLTVEKGAVLRFEKNRYSFSGLDFRNVIKINANIQPGNSGGPAIQNGKVIGLAFQINTLGKEIAYLIPNEIIMHFLKDLEDGRYDGFPNLGFSFQNGLPTTLKDALRIPKDESGVFVNRIYPNSSFSSLLLERDFVNSIDGFRITNEGEVYKEGTKISLIEYIENFQLGQKISFGIYRKGKSEQVTAELKKNSSLTLYRDSPEEYFSQAGLVFQPVSKVFFGSEEGDLNSSLKYHYSYFIQDILYRYVDRDIVLSYVFDDPETDKYKSYKFKVLESINGTIPKDLTDLKRIWKENKKNYVILKFRGMDQSIVFAPDSTKAIQIRVKKRYGAVSDEL